jgi:hypothetical protein
MIPNCGLLALLVAISFPLGYAVAQLVKALRYKPEGRRFYSRWGLCDFFIVLILGAAQLLTEMSTRDLPWR